ncbi:MAG: TIGR00266 family protein, partial [Candidatus Poseidoniales archaeon]
AYGAIKEIEITPDSPIVVDNGHLVAYSEGVNYTVDKSGGWKTTMLGGEGLILRFSGIGKIWIQSRNLESLASTLIPFMGSN